MVTIAPHFYTQEGLRALQIRHFYLMRKSSLARQNCRRLIAKYREFARDNNLKKKESA